MVANFFNMCILIKYEKTVNSSNYSLISPSLSLITPLQLAPPPPLPVGLLQQPPLLPRQPGVVEGHAEANTVQKFPGRAFAFEGLL